MTQIKICGLRTEAHVRAAVAAGADLLGFVFAPSRRQVTLEQATTLIKVARAVAQRPVCCVGLFVNEPPRQVAHVVAQCGLDAVQLSGDEPYALWADALDDLLLLKAVRLNEAPAEREWLSSDPARVRLLVDAHVAGSYGGTGTLADWQRAARLAHQRPLMLAGGLTPDNVADAMRAVRPWGVDVSSGVESGGIKNPVKMKAFVAAVRAVPVQAQSADGAIDRTC